MENETEKLTAAQDRLLKVLADTHCDFVTINRLSEFIEQAAAVGKGEPGARHVQITVMPGKNDVSWTADSTKIRAKMAGEYE